MSVLPGPDGRCSSGGRSPYRLIVSDIDGTLLDSGSVLRPSVIAAIDTARQAGLIFTLATGRRYATTVQILQALGLTHGERVPGEDVISVDGMQVTPSTLPPVVLQTGAVVATADGRQVLYRNPMPRADAMRAIQILVRLGLQPILYEDTVHEQRLFTGPAAFDTPAGHRYLAGSPHLVVRCPYQQLVADSDPLQIAVIGDRDPLEAAIPHLRLAHCRTIISYSGNLDSYFMEVFHKNCDKGRAAAQLASHLGLTLEQTVSIGDNWNDIEMLGMAGCGVVVANADPGVIPYARRVTLSNDEDAVAAVLHQIVAGEEPGIANPRYDPALRI